MLILFFTFENKTQAQFYGQALTFNTVSKSKIPIKDVRDMTLNGDIVYLQTNDSVIVINQSGVIKDRKKQQHQNGLTFEKNLVYSIDPAGVVYKASEVLTDLSGKFRKENITAKFLSKSGDALFSCFVNKSGPSYSDCIVKIEPQENYILTNLVGIPAGLYTDSNFAWYLFNKSKKDSNGMLRKYDIRTGELLSESEVPVISPAGLYLESNSLYTFSNYTNELVVLNFIEK